ADAHRITAHSEHVITQDVSSEPQQRCHRENVMKNTLIQSRIRLAVMCALALGVFAAPATAQVPAPAGDHLLVTDSSGAPVFTGFGECLHAGFGSARQWTRGCDPTPVAQYIAPVAAEPKAAPMVVAAAAPVVYEKVAFDANVMF